jgi:hypothetical protein
MNVQPLRRSPENSDGGDGLMHLHASISADELCTHGAVCTDEGHGTSGVTAPPDSSTTEST